MSFPAIRIAHLADTHLGYRALPKLDSETERNQRAVDIEHAFEAAISDILTREVDLVIHAGDVFHHTRPSWQAMRTFVRQMRRLEEAKVPVVLIAGNHDTPRLRTTGTAFSVLDLALPGVRFITGYEAEKVGFKELNLVVHGVPHGALAFDAIGPAAFPVPGTRNILMTHGMIPGMAAVTRAEPGEEEIGDALLDATFDYIALGHYHVFHRPRANAWYSGSTERTGWGDEDVTPGYALVEFAEGSKEPAVTHIDIPARTMRTLAPIDGEAMPAREIADIALKRAAALNDPAAMTRIEVRNAPRPVRREAESLLRRESPGVVWSLDLYARGDLLALIGERTALQGEIGDIRTMFGAFVDERVAAKQYDAAFAELFRAKGLHALEGAMVQVSQAMTEDAG